MKRKDFIVKASLAAFAISTSCAKTNDIEPIDAKKEEEEELSDCETTSDILGPFYRANAPQRQDMTFAGLKGNEVEIKGTVFKSDCKTPLTNALVEIWHCDTAGEYDNNSSEFKHRATWLTNSKGEYSFKTILPGKYLNGALYRPSHIHFKISEKNSNSLVSQIYFMNDPHIEKDPWASSKKAEKRILPITLEDTNGNLAVRFDINLKDL